jgi:hypothetical protein
LVGRLGAGTLIKTSISDDYMPVELENWTCGYCKNVNPAGAPLCICGQLAPTASAGDSPRPKRPFPLWAAAVPGLLIAIFFSVNAMLQFSRAAGTIAPKPLREPDHLACVDTYAVTLNPSDQYVREWTLGAPANSPNQSPEVSTVVRGMARNDCGENLVNIRLRFVVHDDAGKKGEGVYLIEKLGVGEVKPFDRAWMGRVVSYEITADR